MAAIQQACPAMTLPCNGAGGAAGEGEGYGGHLRNNTAQSATHISITERDLALATVLYHRPIALFMEINDGPDPKS